MQQQILNLPELRNWILLALALLGAMITLKTFINSTQQRKIDNTFKTLDFLRRHIGDAQIKTFAEAFHANNPLTGVNPNEFNYQGGRTDTIETMFSEGGYGNGDIHNMIELFNLVAPTLAKLDANIIWYEYGQIMSKVYEWTKYLEVQTSGNNPESDCPNFFAGFNSYMKRNNAKMLFKPVKYYVYGE